MTLVTAYERLIGGRGSEILPGQPAPPIPDKPPVILHPGPVPEASLATPVATPQPGEKPEISASKHAKPQRHHQARKKRRHRHSDG